MEGANPINDDLGLLRMFHRLGIRYLTLTHGKTSNWIDSATDDPKHNGLSPFGQEVVREMNRLGMMVDVSHISVKAFYDVLEVARAPVIASHSSALALTSIPRNMNDEQLRALAKNGGVIQVAMGSWFIKEGNDAARSTKEFKDWLEQQRTQTKEKCGVDPKCRSLEGLKRNSAIMNRLPRGTLQDVADHIDHIVKVAGIDHVGYGSDFDGVNSMPEGLDDVTFLPALTQELARRGYSDDDIRKVLGGNTLRVMEAVERVAAEHSN
jgi:membrane dipeptidase